MALAAGIQKGCKGLNDFPGRLASRDGLHPTGSKGGPQYPVGARSDFSGYRPRSQVDAPPPRGFSGGEEGAVLSTMAGWGGGLKAFKVINEIHISGATCLSETIPGRKTLEKQVFYLSKWYKKDEETPILFSRPKGSISKSRRGRKTVQSKCELMSQESPYFTLKQRGTESIRAQKCTEVTGQLPATGQTRGCWPEKATTYWEAQEGGVPFACLHRIRTHMHRCSKHGMVYITYAVLTKTFLSFGSFEFSLLQWFNF